MLEIVKITQILFTANNILGSFLYLPLSYFALSPYSALYIILHTSRNEPFADCQHLGESEPKRFLPAKDFPSLDSNQPNDVVEAKSC